MKKWMLVLACLVAAGSSFAAYADEARVVCTAGTTIPKHDSEYFGDPSTSKQEAMQSAMDECLRESEFNTYCHNISCFTEDRY
jgi:hypothetical protein